MKRNKVLVISVAVLFVVIMCSMLIYNKITELAGYVDKLPQGQDAVNAMSETERSFLENKMLKIEAGMTEADLVNVLGPPVEYGIVLQNKTIDYWNCPQNDKECLIRAKIQDGKVYVVEWLKMDSFFWQKKFDL